MSTATGVVEVERPDLGEMFRTEAVFLTPLAWRSSRYIATHFGNCSGDGLDLDRNFAVTASAQNGLEVDSHW